jgi:hypothetical protein
LQQAFNAPPYFLMTDEFVSIQRSEAFFDGVDEAFLMIQKMTDRFLRQSFRVSARARRDTQ